METEKSLLQSAEEKKAIDASGHSEKLIDIRMDKAVTSQQTVANTPIFQSKKKEKVILEIK